MVFARLLIAAQLAALPLSAAAEAVAPVELESIRHGRASLSVSGPTGEATYTPAELEALGAMRMVTTTPWRPDETTFDGVLLSELLETHGLLDVSAIRVIAENDYAVTIPAEVWETWPVLVATRVNGEPHTRRERGPIQFVLPMSEDASAGEGPAVHYWVWMAARIEPVD